MDSLAVLRLALLVFTLLWTLPAGQALEGSLDIGRLLRVSSSLPSTLLVSSALSLRWVNFIKVDSSRTLCLHAQRADRPVKHLCAMQS